MWNECYKMELGETVKNPNNPLEKITRVPSGWLYVCFAGNAVTSCFIPFSNIFETSF